jgi:transcriptional regulator with XRE-family HTH domain
MEQNIGSHLEALRLSCGYSLREASKKSGLSHGYIRDVELGVNRKSGSQIIPMPQTLRKFGYAYGANFNDLMRIAGHIGTEETEEKTYDLVELNLFSVLYVQVDEYNHVNYHLLDRVYTEEKSLHEYMILEEQLESNHFLRTHIGIYANLNQIRAFDEKNSRIFFDERLAGKYVDIPWLRASKFRSDINRAIEKNNNMDMEIKLQPKNKLSMIVRSIMV